MQVHPDLLARDLDISRGDLLDTECETWDATGFPVSPREMARSAKFPRIFNLILARFARPYFPFSSRIGMLCCRGEKFPAFIYFSFFWQKTARLYVTFRHLANLCFHHMLKSDEGLSAFIWQCKIEFKSK